MSSLAVVPRSGSTRTPGIDEPPMTLLVDPAGNVRARQMSYGVDPEDWVARWREVIEAEIGIR